MNVVGTILPITSVTVIELPFPSMIFQAVFI